METDSYEQDNVAMVPPELVVSATTNPLSPSDLMISSTGSASAGQEPEIASTIALARINRTATVALANRRHQWNAGG